MFPAALTIIAKNWHQSRCPSTGESLNKLQYIHGILQQLKRGETIHTYNNLDESPENYTVWKKPVSKSNYDMYDSDYITFWKRQDYGDSKKIHDCRGWGEERLNRQSTEDFQDRETILCDNVMVDIRYYTFVQTHRMYHTNGEPDNT